MTLAELKQFFSSHPLPTQLRVSRAILISDLRKFVESHLHIIEAREGIPAFACFIDRLIEVKEILEGKEVVIE